MYNIGHITRNLDCVQKIWINAIDVHKTNILPSGIKLICNKSCPPTIYSLDNIKHFLINQNTRTCAETENIKLSNVSSVSEICVFRFIFLLHIHETGKPMQMGSNPSRLINCGCWDVSTNQKLSILPINIQIGQERFVIT